MDNLGRSVISEQIQKEPREIAEAFAGILRTHKFTYDEVKSFLAWFSETLDTEGGKEFVTGKSSILRKDDMGWE